MAKFRNVSPDERVAVYGLPAATLTKPDGILEIPDTPVREGEEQTYADGYRNQPTIWAEVATRQPSAPKGDQDTEEVQK